MAFTRIVLTVEYNGKCYYGSQYQVGLPTVQDEIERSIQRLTGEKCRIATASRTDAGVHARAQVISFLTGSDLPERSFIGGMNYYLPSDIAVKKAYRMPLSFDVRRDALSREYRYYILNDCIRSPLWQGYSYLVKGGLDIELMNKACHLLLGKHDFASFASRVGGDKKVTVRCVYLASIVRRSGLIIYDMKANSFLPHQVRNTVGSLIKLGLGRMNIREFCSIIEARVPGMAGPAAPACGLYLVGVNYPVSLGVDRK